MCNNEPKFVAENCDKYYANIYFGEMRESGEGEAK